MTVHTLTGTTTDAMGATDTDTVTINSTAAAPPRVIRRSMLENRIQWGSVVDTSPLGPWFSDEKLLGYNFYTQGAPITLGLNFYVERAVTFTGCRIYKAPNATGTDIPVVLWSGTDVGTELGRVTIPEWVVDDGGWRQITFDTPIDLIPETNYCIGYFAPDGIYSYTTWVWNGQNSCVWPLHVKQLGQVAGLDVNGSGVWHGEPDIAFPHLHLAHNYYVDPQVEWTDTMPGYDGDAGYFEQFINYKPRHAFPVAVFFADPESLADYYAMGVNTLMAGYAGDPRYVEAMASIDYQMDWWTAFSAANPAEVLQVMGENPELAEAIIGYNLDDEPDQTAPYRSPTLHLEWRNSLRQLDATRPFYTGFTSPVLRNQSFGWNPQGATPLQVNELWRQWMAIADVVGCDDYVWFYNNNAAGLWGPWTYAVQARRLREVCDYTRPAWVTVETTSGISNAVPTPENIRKSCWAAIIGGARGIVLFDHRFGNDFVAQDFAHMLHNTATDPVTGRTMKQMMTAFSARLQTMGPALLGRDLGLITEWTSSNKTAGPMGGTFGVPLHYATRADDVYEYAIVQSSRPGATTGTVTIPTWASQTVTVVDESRNETVSSGGVITDTFDDYAVHIYRRTL